MKLDLGFEDLNVSVLHEGISMQLHIALFDLQAFSLRRLNPVQETEVLLAFEHRLKPVR